MNYAQRGQSLNSIQAKREGRWPATYWLKLLPAGCNAADIREAIGVGEWHHTGRHANCTAFYEEDDIMENIPEIVAARDARLAASATETFTGYVEWIEWSGTRNYPKASRRRFEGEITLKGNWLHFDGRRKYVNGNQVSWRREVGK